MRSLLQTIAFCFAFAKVQTASLLRVGVALVRRAIFGPTLPSWNVFFEVAVTLMKGSLVKDFNLARALIDTDIMWMPIFPSNVAVIKGEKLSAFAAHPTTGRLCSQSPFEWIYRKSDTEKPWNTDSNCITSALNGKKILLYFHGGAFIFGARGGFHTLFLCNLVEMTGCVVLFLDYKRSPEYVYPGPQEDCFAALSYLTAEIERLQLTNVSLFIGGDSAGGALAVDTLVKHSKQISQGGGGSRVLGGILLSPWTDIFNYSDKSWAANQDFDYVESDRLLHCANMHFPHEDRAEQHKISPLYQPLKGLPPLLIEVGGREAFLDQCQAFGEKARQEGVHVTLNVYTDMVHAFHMLIFSKAAAIYESIRNINKFMNEHTQTTVEVSSSLSYSSSPSPWSRPSAAGGGPSVSAAPSASKSSSSSSSLSMSEVATTTATVAAKNIIKAEQTTATSSTTSTPVTNAAKTSEDKHFLEILQRSQPPIYALKGDEAKIEEFLKMSHFSHTDIILALHNVLDTVSAESRIIEGFYRSQFKICALSFVGREDGLGSTRYAARDELTARINNGQIDAAIMVFERGEKESELKSSSSSASASTSNTFDEYGSKAWAIRAICQGGVQKRRVFFDNSEDHIESSKYVFDKMLDDLGATAAPIIKLFIPNDEESMTLTSVLNTYIEETLMNESSYSI